MTDTPTQGDRADFAAFCREVTTAQLHNVIRKEEAANRQVYAEIARAELDARTRSGG